MVMIDNDMTVAKVNVKECERERLEAEEETRNLVEQQQDILNQQRILKPEIKHLQDQNTQQFSLLSECFPKACTLALPSCVC